ncbi:MAG: preprotein translocase subunit SecA [Planctomycetes bacterium]|nr:preprotein translocase subunit SecA [Planctomycetota bacterium]
MEILDKFGDAFNVVLGGTERFITRMFGSSNERRVRGIGYVRDKQGNSSIVPGSTLDRINQLEPTYETLSDSELRETASKLRRQLADGKTLDDLLPDAFAAVREAGKRYLKMRHYDVQMVGGYILHKGMIAEMVTGEGKTLVASLPAFLNGVAGSVHVITVNDYLAKRDMEWMGPLHMGLGLTIGAIQSNTSHEEKRKAYACDITYGTNNEFGFDYLRDNMKSWKEEQVQGPLVYAIIDEIDNILIDEARTPLIISGRAHDDVSKYPVADKLARQLQRDVHFELKEKEHTCHLTEAGIRRAEEIAGVESFYTPGNMEWPHLIDNSLRAHHLYKRDVNYIVRNGEVIIIDDHTGRMMEGRQWSDGLHQAVEAKEGVKIKEETQTLATVTLQNFFKLYKKLSGMTGTAMTEAAEFVKIYNLDVVTVPTNRPLKRINYPDAIYRTEKEKWNAVVEEIKEVHATDRPVLVGTVSIENSEKLSNMLTRNGIQHAVLNAKYHEREAEIIAQAGRMSGVTIATNMAGRGTDIILGGNPEYLAWDELKLKYESRLDVPKSEWDAATKAIAEREGMAEQGRKVAELGGLHVIGTERHESRRIDLQLRGRAGRQGDNGSSRFFLSLEDDLMRKFGGEWVKEWLAALGMQEGERIESKMVTRQIESSQKKVEERHFEQRKNLLEYDEVMDEQRKRVYSYRQVVLEGADCRTLILAMIDKQLDRWTNQFLKQTYRWETIVEWARQKCEIELEIRDVRGMEPDDLIEYLKSTAERQADIQIQEKIEENLPNDVEDDRERNWQAMSMWINRRFGLNTNDRELKKIGLDDIHQALYTRAVEAIQRFDFSPCIAFLSDDWGRQSLSGWVRQQYALEIPATAFEGQNPEDAAQLIKTQIVQLYQLKEVEFPVSVGLSHFMAEGRYNREGLVHWIANRFNTAVSLEDLEQRSRADIVRILMDISSQYLAHGKSIRELDARLDKACAPATNGHAVMAAGLVETDPVTNPAAVTELIEWTNREFQTELDPAEFQQSNRRSLANVVRWAYERKYRPELYQTERNVIIDTLDTAWKDHLYFMDHLRSGIGLVGYAQKDPKTEYRREGMAAFEQMWDRIAAQVTGTVFRIEVEVPEASTNVWQITSTEHASPTEDIPDDHPALAGTQPGENPQPIDPIRNFGDRTGRNDPCPCGSGKKYKKCHGAGL